MLENNGNIILADEDRKAVEILLNGSRQYKQNIENNLLEMNNESKTLFECLCELKTHIPIQLNDINIKINELSNSIKICINILKNSKTKNLSMVIYIYMYYYRL